MVIICSCCPRIVRASSARLLHDQPPTSAGAVLRSSPGSGVRQGSPASSRTVTPPRRYLRQRSTTQRGLSPPRGGRRTSAPGASLPLWAPTRDHVSATPVRVPAGQPPGAVRATTPRECR
ncbi:MAG: hypothetical protein AVDCRST_MAG48-3136 [uncultured Friedmanniella sp.]|uniref:Uncharacterized protein n=1 Tax=uncultured Friedmanniella sp. TaxID=335381 RepID=A0A6J4LFR9_9ACTN|nr:MAG: hypothetical protein AVDCRST_MAG48-3136 [uncultured Friedmanniella sp.]